METQSSAAVGETLVAKIVVLESDPVMLLLGPVIQRLRSVVDHSPMKLASGNKLFGGSETGLEI